METRQTSQVKNTLYAWEDHKTGNQYGPVHASDRAVVHLGDTSNNLHIQELHLHLDSFSEPLRLLQPVARLSQYGANMMRLGRRIARADNEEAVGKHLDAAHEESQKYETLRGLNDVFLYQLLDNTADLYYLKGQLTTTLHHIRRSTSSLRPSMEIVSLIENAMIVAIVHASFIAKFRLALLATDTDFTQPSNEMYSSRIDLKREFLRLWFQTGLSRQLEQISSYQYQVARELSRMINVSSIPATRRIREIISINESANTDTAPFSTIFTTASGTSVATNRDTSSVTAFKGSVASDFITYSLDDEVEQQVSAQFRVKHAPSSRSVKAAPNFVHEILKQLQFEGEYDREVRVSPAHSKTFSWILTQANSRFRLWLAEKQPCFWICGKAGSGKSTLMKYISQHVQFHQILSSWAAGRRLVIATFFFWYAGRELQKSQEGILRSLLNQILRQRPDLATLILPGVCRDILSKYLDQDYGRVMIDLSCLMEAFRILMDRLPQNVVIFLLVDGVDEFFGDHYEFARFLLELTQNPSIKLLVSSRPIPECHHAFMEYPSIRLQDLTRGDMQTYINDKVLSDPLLLERTLIQPDLVQKIGNVLLEKASGVFLWMVLVVKDLQHGLRHYVSPKSLMAIIDSLPSDLEELYDHLFGRLTSKEQQAGSKLLQFMMFSRKMQPCPLTAIQLYVIEMADDLRDLSNDAVSYNAEVARIRAKYVDGLLRSQCCGLLEVQYQGPSGEILNEPEVEFLHLTVYDYLRSDEVWHKVKRLYHLDNVVANFSLLASCAHLIKHRIAYQWNGYSMSGLKPDLGDAYNDPYPPQFWELLLASVRCSLALEIEGHHNYADLLSAINIEFLTTIQRLGIEEATFIQRHTDLFYEEQKVREETQPIWDRNLDKISKTVGDDRYASYDAHVRHQLTPAVITFARDIEKSIHPTDQGLTLLHMLNASCRTESPFMPLFAQNVAALLSIGVDPRMPVPCSERRGLGLPPHIASCSGPTQAYRSQISDTHIEPWYLWIYQCDPTNPYHIEITLWLLNEGLDYSSTPREPLDLKARMVWATMAGLYERLILREDCPHTAANLDAILRKVDWRPTVANDFGKSRCRSRQRFRPLHAIFDAHGYNIIPNTKPLSPISSLAQKIGDCR